MVLFTPIAEEIKEFNPLLKGISQKVNIIVQVEFELAYFEVTIQHFSNYTMAPLQNNMF